MPEFKCKMCGSTMNVEQGATIGLCNSCGAKQTLPCLDNEKKSHLYDRADHFRRNNDFDKAMSIYKQILNEDDADAEAHWLLVLCRYGVEYVEDPSSHKWVPTVNRTQFVPIFEDKDYRSALQYADRYQKYIYEDEAKAINEIQEGILAIAQKEEPVDIFLCCKESDESGRRTQDSVLANDLYYQLTQEGFRVFFSHIALEDKPGTACEPYIFAALQSARVMVVLGTKPEYFNAAWVKNEWSRYLALIKNGAKKTLIPAYRDMDPYDLPEEFSHLQAQDMSRLGFMRDLIRTIEANDCSDVPQEQEAEGVTAGGETANPDQMLKRGYLALEDGEWQQADDFFEAVLNQDAENAQAYVGKLMAEQNVGKLEDLKNREFPFDDSVHYQKVLRFAEPAVAEELKGYIDCINERNEQAEKDSTYRYAVSAMNEGAYRVAAAVFESIPEVRDSETLAEQCRTAAKKAVIKRRWVIVIAILILCAVTVSLASFFAVIRPKQKLEKALEMLDAGYYKRANSMLEELGKGRTITSSKYETGLALLKRGDYEAAYVLLRDLSYKDSAEKATESYDKYKNQKLKESHVGDTVYFGTYEQDGDTANGREDIKWLVLAKEEGKALIISKYALDCLEYNTSYEGVTWETCSLRTWLNETFLSNAFSFNEQKNILTTDVSADENSKYDTDPGNATSDKVFLLSIAEAEQYFSADQSRKCAPTAYAKAQGTYQSDIYRSENGEATCWWWLRSPGDGQDFAANVYDDGSISYLGVDVYITGGAVRPALWIALDSE